MDRSSGKKTFDLGNVDYLAVTEHKEKRFIFRWNINKARKHLQKENFHMSSPVFVQIDGNTNYEWQLMVQISPRKLGEVEDVPFLSVYLRFCKGKNPTVTAFEVAIVDDLEQVVKKEEGNTTFTVPGTMVGWDQFKIMTSLLDPNFRFIDGDVLKLYCKVAIEVPAEHKMISGARLVTEESETQLNDDFLSFFENLLVSSLFTDVDIITQSKTFKAHRGILSCRSSVFYAMFENEMSESINGTVKIPDFDDDVVNGLLQYIYSGSIDEEILEERATQFLQIAEKYDVKGLKSEAEEVITANLSVENVAESLYLADMYNATYLKAKAIAFLNSNKAEVITTEGFQKMAKNNKSLIVDLYLKTE